MENNIFHNSIKGVEIFRAMRYNINNSLSGGIQMSDRPKLPKSIVVLNIIMIVIILAICALAVLLFVQSKDLGWSLPTPDSTSSVSESSGADSSSGPDTVTVQVSAEAE